MIKSVIEKEEKLMSVKTFRSSNKLYDLMMKIKVTLFFSGCCKNGNCSEIFSLSMCYYVIFMGILWIGS